VATRLKRPPLPLLLPVLSPLSVLALALLLLAFGLGLLARSDLLLPAEEPLALASAGWRGSWGWWLARSLSAVGGPAWVVGLLVVVAAAVWWRRRARIAVLAPMVAAGGWVASEVLKRAVARPRPAADLLDIGQQLDGFGFPSGHALVGLLGMGLAAYALLSLLPPGRLRGVLVALALLVGAAIGASRAVLGVHWWSDVLGGWLIAAAGLLVVIEGHRAQRRRAAANEGVSRGAR